MTDIVERLRDHKNYSPLHHEAAAEIERLQAKLEEMTKRFKYSEQVVLSLKRRGYS